MNGLAFIFTEGLWNFAAKTSSITGTTVGAIPGFSYSFTKPPDWVRTIVISTNSLFDTEATYRDENGKFYSNWDTLYIRYISNTLAADGSISSWPTMFCEVASGKVTLPPLDVTACGTNTERPLPAPSTLMVFALSVLPASL
mgnify:CR=1 FL=1